MTPGSKRFFGNIPEEGESEWPLLVRLQKGLAPIHSTRAMFRGVLRVALSVGLMLALWTVSRPAAAAMPAGVCDDRGASAIAPPPALEGPEEAIQRARAPFSCGGEFDARVSVFPGHRGGAVPEQGPPSALPADLPLLPAPEVGPSLLASSPDTLRGFAVHFRVERPPRG